MILSGERRVKLLQHLWLATPSWSFKDARAFRDWLKSRGNTPGATKLGGNGVMLSYSAIWGRSLHWCFMTSQITGISTVCSKACSGNNKWNIKAPHYWPFVRGIHQSKKASKPCIAGPLWGESTGDQWIPLTKGQKHGKRFHVMKPSCKPAYKAQLLQIHIFILCGTQSMEQTLIS